MDRRQFAALAIAVVAFASGGAAVAASPPATWDGLARVPSKKLKFVYLLPGADFRPYSKVMVDPTQIAFKKNWRQDYNSQTAGGRISDSDVERMITEGGKTATEIFAQVFAKGGYPVVTEPGPDVLKVRTAVINLSVTSPDTMSGGRSRSMSREAGSATLVIEVADSVSGAILGRAVDSQVAGENSYMMGRNSVTNRADFSAVAKTWAQTSVNGLNELKRQAPGSAAP